MHALDYSQRHQKFVPRVRWLVLEDMPEVLAIDGHSFRQPWLEEDFIRALRRKEMCAIVATRSVDVVGYALYALYEHDVVIARLAVAPEMRRGGVGTYLLDRLKFKLRRHGRRRVVANVPEDSLPAQLALRAAGFRAVKVLSDLEAYRFEFRLPKRLEGGID